MTTLGARGWVRFGPDEATLRWVETALPAARKALDDSRVSLRCGDTWDVGLDLLPNDDEGTIDGVPLTGDAMAFLHGTFGRISLHRAQLSAVYPGYPQPWGGESEAAYHYRLNRDAAHIDGLLPVGPDRRRMIREPHAYILGLPLTGTGQGASPPVIWEGSHRIMVHALGDALSAYPEAAWPDVDITAAYHAARREIFQSCRRVVLHAEPGEAIVIHRLALHGISPWQDGAQDQCRIIAYFRPELPGGIRDWLAE